MESPLRAWQYARSAFGPFQQRYSKEIQRLIGAIAYAPNLYDSPYRCYFYNDSAWDDVATSFTREFCSLLGLSADSPLYIATTAGAIALPTLLKVHNIMEDKRKAAVAEKEKNRKKAKEERERKGEADIPEETTEEIEFALWTTQHELPVSFVNPTGHVSWLIVL